MKSFVKDHISAIFFIIYIVSIIAGIVFTTHPIHQITQAGTVYIEKTYISTISYILISILISSIPFVIVVKNESKSFFNIKNIFDSFKSHPKKG